MTREPLEEVWNRIQKPAVSESISGIRAIGLPIERPVYISLDGKGRRHLLVKVPDTIEPINNISTRALDVKTDRFHVGSNPESTYIDLICLDPAQQPTFSSFSQDIILSLKNTTLPQRDTVLNAFARWRAFWSVNQTGMSHEDTLGLLGELWFLIRWLAPVNRQTIECWQATSSARHDIQSQKASIEIKTACSSASIPIHLISSLDQLDDPESGELYLFSLHIREDRLSNNTLHSLVNGIAGELQNDFRGLNLFNEKLAARGYLPSDQNHPERSFRILAERLYHVTDNFPRITRNSFQNGMPVGIENLKYSIDLSACDEWLIASGPIEIDRDRLK